jgi:hypothetical protein
MYKQASTNILANSLKISGFVTLVPQLKTVKDYVVCNAP